MANFFAELVRGLTKPVRGIAERGNILGAIAKGLVTGKDVVVNPTFGTTRQETMDLGQRPVRTAIKDLASLGAYAVPAGNGIAGLAKSGALSGALTGLGTSETGKELGGILSGGITGGIVGGGLGVLGEGINKVRGLASKVNKPYEEGLLASITPKKTGLTPAETDKAKELVLNTYKQIKGDKLGLSVNEIANSSDDIIKTLAGGIDDLSNATVDGAKKEIFSNATSKVDLQLLNKKANGVGGKAVKDILNSIDNLSDTPTVAELRSIAQDIDKLVNYKAGGAVKTTGAVNFERELKGLRDIVREQLSKVDGADEALSNLSNAMRITELLPETASKTPGVTVLGTRVNLPQSVNENIQKGTTGLLEGIAGQARNVPNTTSLLGSLIGVGAPIASSIQTADMGGGNIEDQLNSDQSLNFGKQTEQSQGLDFMSALAMAGQIFPNASESELISLAEKLQKQSAPETTKMNKDQANAYSGLQSVQAIAQIVDQSPNAFFTALLPAGGFDSTTQALQAETTNLADVIGRLRSGAAIGANEEKRFLKLIPKVTDTLANKKRKLARLYNDLGAVYQRGGAYSDNTDALKQLMGL